MRASAFHSSGPVPTTVRSHILLPAEIHSSLDELRILVRVAAAKPPPPPPQSTLQAENCGFRPAAKCRFALWSAPPPNCGKCWPSKGPSLEGSRSCPPERPKTKPKNAEAGAAIPGHLAWNVAGPPHVEPSREGPFEGQHFPQFGAGAHQNANLRFAAGRNPQFSA